MTDRLSQIDWAALERLRAAFLAGTAGRAPYWTSSTDLASYDATFGERIGWKWDAVIAELQRLNWCPPTGPVFDFGCGSGVAGRRVLRHWGRNIVTALRVSDRSSAAEQFAVQRAQAEYPDLDAARFDLGVDSPVESQPATLVISHVLNELPAAARSALLAWIPRFTTVIWVEPGTSSDSRALIEMREQLRAHFRVVAPCTHDRPCGLLAPGRESDWCHFFASPPGGVFADGDWVRFGQRMGIDLRSVPYSYLVLDRRPLPAADSLPSAPLSGGASRLIGLPRMYKGYAKLFHCQADGVSEIVLQKRTDPALFKRLDRGRHCGVFCWNLEGSAVVSGVEMAKIPENEEAGGQDNPVP
jgi:hypothetical protein